MAKFKVLISETLTKTVEVEAEDSDFALEKARKLWECGEIVLGADDFEDVNISIK